MKKLLAVALLMVPLAAGAQVVSTTPPADQPPAPQPQAVPPPPPATPPPASSNAPQEPLPPESDELSGAEPSAPPAANPYVSTPADELPPQPVAVAPPTGQWVYTGQYGWVWMPYGAAYTYLPAGAYPDMYLYVPAYGWRWVVAPWVWGIGPHPYFGVYGWARFPWYGRGYGRWYGFRGGPVWAGHSWGHPGWVARPGVVVTRPGGFARPGPSVIVRSRPVGPPRGFSAPRPGGFHGGNPGGFHGGHPGGFGRH